MVKSGVATMPAVVAMNQRNGWRKLADKLIVVSKIDEFHRPYFHDLALERHDDVDIVRVFFGHRQHARRQLAAKSEINHFTLDHT